MLMSRSCTHSYLPGQVSLIYLNKNANRSIFIFLWIRFHLIFFLSREIRHRVYLDTWSYDLKSSNKMWILSIWSIGIILQSTFHTEVYSCKRDFSLKCECGSVIGETNPMVVFLNSTNRFCNGVRISKNHVLTSNNCFKQSNLPIFVQPMRWNLKNVESNPR